MSVLCPQQQARLITIVQTNPSQTSCLTPLQSDTFAIFAVPTDFADYDLLKLEMWSSRW